MSSDAPDFSELQLISSYYYQYKLAVYDNLSTGIVYGEGQETRRYSPNF
jgi:hypothetical protein